MKIIVFSDIQLNNWQEFSRTLPNGRNSRFQDQLNVLEHIFTYALAQKNGDDVLLVHNGDLFESMTEKIDKQVFLAAYEMFSQFSKNDIPVILLTGNHDWIDKTETAHMVEPFKEIENVVVVDKDVRQVVGDTSLNFIPYTRSNFKNKVAALASKATSKLNYLFTHQGVSGAKVGPRDVLLKEAYSPEDFGTRVFDVVFNGHYHKPQRWGNFWIIGSPVQKDFGERNDRKGFLFLDTLKDPKLPVYEQLDAPRFFKSQVDTLAQLQICASPRSVREQDFLWIISTELTEAAIKGELERMGHNLAHVRIEIEQKREQRTRTDISLNMALDEQVRRAVEYLQHQLNKENLDRDILVAMAVDLCKRGQQG